MRRILKRGAYQLPKSEDIINMLKDRIKEIMDTRS